MKTNSLLWIVIILLSCCKYSSEKSESQTDSLNNVVMDKYDSIDIAMQQSLNIKNYLVDNKEVNSDYLFITKNCGVFIVPDSIEISKMKKEYGDESFYIAADDNSYYDFEASQYLDSMRYKCIYPKTRYLKFKVNSDTICIDTKSKYRDGWLSILYKENKVPKFYYSVNIHEAFKEYNK